MKEVRYYRECLLSAIGRGEMKVGSLFTGIGGLDLGLERAGMKIAWQVEIDPFCRQVLEKHWPHVPKYGDIRQIRGDELEPVDLIAGGFPCQPVSVAGKRKGQKDERWLWPEFARIIRVVRPQYVLVENVPGLLVREMGDVLGDMAEMGYDAEWFVFPARAVGAAHLRERVFIFAHPPGPGLERCRLSEFQPTTPLETITRDTLLSESAIVRNRNGVPHYVDRIGALGNAVVPQVAEVIGKAIMTYNKD